MHVNLLTMDRARLSGVPEVERTFVFGIGHIANEVNVLQKLLYWTAPSEDEDPQSKKAHSTQALTIAKVLSGKLAEGWQFLEKAFFATKLSATYEPKLEAEGAAALSNLKRYFGRKNLVVDIRNKLAFHYSAEHMRSGFELVPSSEDWSILVAESSGNTLYYAADLVANYALLHLVQPSDPWNGLDKLLHELIPVSRWVSDLAASCWVVFTDAYLTDSQGAIPVHDINIEGAPALSDVHVPFFVESPSAQPGAPGDAR
jgi:hypothetical protein